MSPFEIKKKLLESYQKSFQEIDKEQKHNFEVFCLYRKYSDMFYEPTRMFSLNTMKLTSVLFWAITKDAIYFHF